jgi:hypothetical protein
MSDVRVGLVALAGRPEHASSCLAERSPSPSPPPTASTASGHPSTNVDMFKSSSDPESCPNAARLRVLDHALSPMMTSLPHHTTTSRSPPADMNDLFNP